VLGLERQLNRWFRREKFRLREQLRGGKRIVSERASPTRACGVARRC
jgi:hypothetical protein